jgi:hypothetical protein
MGSALPRVTRPLARRMLPSVSPRTCLLFALLMLLGAAGARAEGAPPAATRPIAPLVRIGAETGGGIVGGALLGGTSAWVITATLSPDSGTSTNTAAQVGAALGASVGAPIGVSLTGKLLGRQGSFIVSWLSSVAGLGVGYGIYGLIRAGSDSSAAQAAAEALTEITRASFGTSAHAWMAWWAENRARRRVQWLLAALRNPEPWLRAAAIEELAGALGDTLGYSPDAPDGDRAQAVARWEEAVLDPRLRALDG